jgi:hypothetical protein
MFRFFCERTTTKQTKKQQTNKQTQNMLNPTCYKGTAKKQSKTAHDNSKASVQCRKRTAA